MSCPIVSAMKQVTQGSIIPQRMTINSILIHIMEIVDHDVTASYAYGEMHSDGILNKICKNSIFMRSILARAIAKWIFLFHGFSYSRKKFSVNTRNIWYHKYNIFLDISALFKKVAEAFVMCLTGHKVLVTCFPEKATWRKTFLLTPRVKRNFTTYGNIFQLDTYTISLSCYQYCWR